MEQDRQDKARERDEEWVLAVAVVPVEDKDVELDAGKAREEVRARAAEKDAVRDKAEANRVAEEGTDSR